MKPGLRPKPEAPLLGTCDACRRSRQRVEQTTVDGNVLNLCVRVDACRKATPPLDVICGVIGGGAA